MSNHGGDFNYKTFRTQWDNLLERQKYKDAEKLCHEGLSKSPEDAARGKLYNNLGYLYENYLDDKTFDDILEHYVLSLQVDESNANSHYNLANFLLEQGMQHLLRALELNPNHSKANKRYANLTPIKTHTTLDFGGNKYQVVETLEDGVRAVRLRRTKDGGYEQTNDEPEFVEVGSPKEYPSATGSARGPNAGGRAQNINQQTALEIDNSQNNNNSTNDGDNNDGCCYKCVYFWGFWCLLWIIALGGVAVPVLAYFDIFGTDSCVDKITATQVALNTDANTQGSLNMLFVLDCGIDDWEAQFDAANTLVQQVTSDGSVTVYYQLLQYCNIGAIGGYIGNESVISFEEYSSADPIVATDMTQAEAEDGNNLLVSGALDACKEVYEAFDNTETTPFLCIPFVSGEFEDAFEAMATGADSTFSEIYLAFMVDESDTDYTENVYSVLGAFATGTACIDRLDNDYAFGNSWWDSKFNCDSGTLEHNNCPHCINYGAVNELGCASVEMASIFEGEGVTESKVMIETEEECTHQYDTYFFYAIGGVVPLLFWVCILVFFLICRSCRSKKRRNNSMEQHNGLNNNNDDPKAFV